MTWVVAGTNILGYAFGVSDIQVVCGGEYRDCLQKVYPVSPNLALGFAGAVEIGFRMRDSFASYLANQRCVPDEAVRGWCNTAKQVFSQSASESQKDQSHLLVFGVHPTQEIGMLNRTAPYIYRLRSPDFEVEQIATRAASIGSGGEVDSYRAKVEELTGDDQLLASVQLEMMGHFNFAHSLAMSLGQAITENPQPGVSRHLHVLAVAHGTMVLATTDHDIHKRDGTLESVRMPMVATSWPELISILGQANARAARASLVAIR